MNFADFQKLTEALQTLAAHGGSIELLKMDDGSTHLQVWFQSADLHASQPVDPTDGAFMAGTIVAYVRQFREQWKRRN